MFQMPVHAPQSLLRFGAEWPSNEAGKGQRRQFLSLSFFLRRHFQNASFSKKTYEKKKHNIQKCLVPSNQWCKIFHVLFVSLRFTLHEQVTVKEILWSTCSHPLEDCERLMLSLC